jgi:hypothetical protein
MPGLNTLDAISIIKSTMLLSTYPAKKKSTNSDLSSSSSSGSFASSSPRPDSIKRVKRSFSLSSSVNAFFAIASLLVFIMRSKRPLIFVSALCLAWRFGNRNRKCVSSIGKKMYGNSSKLLATKLYVCTQSLSGSRMALNSNPNPTRPIASNVKLTSV